VCHELNTHTHTQHTGCSSLATLGLAARLVARLASLPAPRLAAPPRLAASFGLAADSMPSSMLPRCPPRLALPASPARDWPRCTASPRCLRRPHYPPQCPRCPPRFPSPRLPTSPARLRASRCPPCLAATSRAARLARCRSRRSQAPAKLKRHFAIAPAAKWRRTFGPAMPMARLWVRV